MNYTYEKLPKLARAICAVLCSVAFFAGCGDDETVRPGTSSTSSQTSTTTSETSETSETGTSSTTAETTGSTTTTGATGETTTGGTTGDEGPCEGATECRDPFGDIDPGLCTDDEECVRGCCVEVFRCRTDADCAPFAGEDVACQDERFPCICDVDSGDCRARYCTSDIDCSEGEICTDGVCASVPDEAGLVAKIVHYPRRLRSGERRRLDAVAIDPVRPLSLLLDVEIAWSAENGAIVDVDEQGFAVAGDLEGRTVITARVAENDADLGDQVEIENTGICDASSVCVLVFDDATGAPIEDALVLLDQEGTERVEATTNAQGYVALPSAQRSAPKTLTIFSQTHSYITLVGVTPADLKVPLSAVVSTEVGLDEETKEFDLSTLSGVDFLRGQPDLSQISNNGELEIALAGFALDSGLLDLNFDLIIGPNIRQFLPPNALGLPTDDPTDIPGGVVAYYNGQAIVPKYNLIGKPGERLAWSLGGRISLSENPSLITEILTAAGGDLNIGRVVSAALPFFRGFYTGVQPRLTLGSDVTLPLREEVDIALTIPTGASVDVRAPLLPQVDGQFLEGVVVLGGAYIPGQGFLPLGITAGVDNQAETPRDGFVDGEPRTAPLDPLRLSMSVMHRAAMQPDWRYMILAVSLGFNTGSDVREATSALVYNGVHGAPLPPRAEFSREDFLPLPEGSAFGDPEDATNRRLLLGVVADADVHRIAFQGNAGRNWVVWFAPGTTAVRLPNAAERSYPDPTQNRSARTQAMVLQPDAQESLDSLVSSQGRDLRDVIGLLEAFSLVEL